MNLPPFALMRRAVQDGLIGKLRGLTLYNSGFLYHGLALIRSFDGFKRPHTTWHRKVGSFSKIVGYSFAGGYRAIVVGPHRSRYTSGLINIEGSMGVITDFSGDSEFVASNGRPIYTLTSQRAEDGLLTGFTLEGADHKYTVDLPEIRCMACMDFPDKSDLNLLKNCGIAEIFRALDEPSNLNNAYGPANMTYDAFAARLAGRGFLPLDPFVWFGSDVINVFRLACTGLSSVLPSAGTERYG
jgi:hypothetical protein